MLNFIIWDVSPEIFTIFGRDVRWYGLFFAFSFLLGTILLSKFYKREGKNEKDVDTITIYMLVATVVGARLGHCLFYGFEYYFIENPSEIIAVWDGGLASHGAAFGILFGVWLYARKHPDQSYLYLLDRIVITIALAAVFIRGGNLMNSEIVGKPTKEPYGFIFVHDTKAILEKNFKSVQSISFDQNGKDTTIAGIRYAGIDAVITLHLFDVKNAGEFVQNEFLPYLNSCGYCNDYLISTNKSTYRMIHEGETSVTIAVPVYGIPRHATQIYEALTSLILFSLLMFLYYKTDAGFREGRLFAIFVIWIFGLRFAHEYFKENQEVFESGMQQSLGLNMGQLLSIPLIVVGVYILIRSYRKDFRQ